jgi:hypothetical protein
MNTILILYESIKKNPWSSTLRMNNNHSIAPIINNKQKKRKKELIASFSAEK